MKHKILTTISTLMIFIPWSILPLRNFEWALKLPAAEIMITCCAAFMIFSGIFTILAYCKGKVHNVIMKICLVINTIYALCGLVALGMMFLPDTMQPLKYL